MAKLLRATWCSISWDCYSNLELSVFHPSDISDGCRCCTWRSVDTPVLSSLTPMYGIPFFLCAKEGVSKMKMVVAEFFMVQIFCKSKLL
jgi:hypothetical protein